MVNVDLFRYPRAQKPEIECLIDEMLAGGIIRPNISLVSSQVQG